MLNPTLNMKKQTTMVIDLISNKELLLLVVSSMVLKAAKTISDTMSPLLGLSVAICGFIAAIIALCTLVIKYHQAKIELENSRLENQIKKTNLSRLQDEPND